MKTKTDLSCSDNLLIYKGLINKDLSEGIIDKVIKVYDFYDDTEEIYDELCQDNEATSSGSDIDNGKNDNTNLDFDFSGKKFN